MGSGHGYMPAYVSGCSREMQTPGYFALSWLRSKGMVPMGNWKKFPKQPQAT